MQYIFNVWEKLKKRLLRARHIFLCADFDGTITPIKARPAEVNLCAAQRLLLGKLSQHQSFSLGIISGRALKDLKEKVNLRGLIYVGNHGLEIAYKKKKFTYPAAKKFIPVISDITRELIQRLEPFPGAVLEAKELSLSLHYRLVKKERLSRLKKIFLQSINPYIACQKIRLAHGKKVWELRPPIEWNKGKALLWLVQRLKSKELLTIYIGDDLTDEDAFGAVNKIGGISILVGRKKNSCAQYYLKNTKDTLRFLRKISQIKMK